MVASGERRKGEQHEEGERKRQQKTAGREKSVAKRNKNEHEKKI